MDIKLNTNFIILENLKPIFISNKNLEMMVGKLRRSVERANFFSFTAGLQLFKILNILFKKKMSKS